MTKTITLPARRTSPRSLRAYLAGPPAVGQRALAEAVGCNQSMISMLARGARQPSARLAVKLHAVTGIPLRTLLMARMGPESLAKRRRPTARGDPGRTHAPT